MEKIEFNIKYRPQIESGEYKVVTSFGEPVEIVKWDCKGGYPLLACIDDGDCDDAAFYTEDGRAMRHPDISYLDIVTPDPMTEFEKAVAMYLDGKGLIIDANAQGEQIKVIATKLLDLAREEIEKECSTKDAPRFFKEKIVEAMEIGKAEALKDLPRWRIWRNGACGNPEGHAIALVEGCGGMRFVSCLSSTGEKYIMLDDIKKLPGFNEE